MPTYDQANTGSLAFRSGCRHKNGVRIRRAARPADRRPQGVPVLLPGRSLPGGDGRPLGILRRQRAAGRRAAPGAGRPGRPGGHLRGQRLRFCRCGAEAGRRQAGHQDHPQYARPATRQGQNRTLFRSRAAGVPHRDRRRHRHHGPGRAEQAVHRLVRDGLPCPAARRDRAAADRAVAGRGPVPRPVASPAAGGVLVGRVPGRPKGPPRSSCSAAPARPTRRWPAGRSNASSTRSAWPSSRSAGTAGPGAWQNRSTSAGTPIPRPNRRLPPRRRLGPASTTWPSSPPGTTKPPAVTASATTPSPTMTAAASAGGTGEGR